MGIFVLFFVSQGIMSGYDCYVFLDNVSFNEGVFIFIIYLIVYYSFVNIVYFEFGFSVLIYVGFGGVG